MHRWDENERDRIKRVRRRGRTDLQFLANEILGYPDVCREVHGPVIDMLQPFAPYQGDDVVLKDGTTFYTPPDPEPNQVIRREDGRRRLILDPRAFLKTTINVITHSIQWILNYPDVAILIIHAAEHKALDILRELKAHFLVNERFRYYYPEYVPWGTKAIRNFGTTQQFTVPNRKRARKEPTICVGSVDKKLASAHYHVIKFTDVVDETNVKEEAQRNKVTEKYGLSRSLLVDPHHWIDIEGTRYHLGDLYGQIIEYEWFKKTPEEREWDIHVRSVYKKVVKGGEKFTPDYLDAPYQTDDKGRKIPWWPKDRNGHPKFDLKTLENMRTDPITGEWLFACQYLNNPLETSQEVAFPVNRMKWIPEDALKRVPREFVLTSVDTASTQHAKSNDSAITTCLWDRAGRQYVQTIDFGKMLPDEIVKTIFAHVAAYRPDAVYIEETEFVRGLKPSITRMCEITGVWPNFVFLPRDTHVSKTDRILKHLQPPFKYGNILFSEALPEHVKDRLKVEFSEFPMGSRDDLLDTLADQYQERDTFGAVRPRRTVAEYMKHAAKRWLGQESWEEMKEFVHGGPEPQVETRRGGSDLLEF